LISRLDYLGRLGVTCLWLNPIYPSAWRDEGYDVSDYYNVDRDWLAPRLRRASPASQLAPRSAMANRFRDQMKRCANGLRDLCQEARSRAPSWIAASQYP
jgi:hypothetical protein